MQSAKPQWALGPAGGVMDPAVASRAAEIPKPLSAAAQWIAASYWIAAEQWQRNSRQRSQRWRLRSPCRRRWGARCSGALRSRPPLTCTGLHIVRSSPGTGAQGRSTERVENLSRATLACDSLTPSQARNPLAVLLLRKEPGQARGRAPTTVASEDFR